MAFSLSYDSSSSSITLGFLGLISIQQLEGRKWETTELDSGIYGDEDGVVTEEAEREFINMKPNYTFSLPSSIELAAAIFEAISIPASSNVWITVCSWARNEACRISNSSTNAVFSWRSLHKHS